MLCGGIQCAFLRCFCPFSKGAPGQSPVWPVADTGGVRPCAKALHVRLQTREGGASLRQSPVCPVADTGDASLRQSPACPGADTGVRPCARAQCVRLQTRSRLEFVVAVHRDSKYESQVPTTHYSLQQTHRVWRGRKPPLPILPATDTQGLAWPQTYHA